MSFNLSVWNGMSDTERLKDFVRVMSERDEAVRLLWGARDDVVEAANRRTHKPHAVAYYKDQLARIDAFLAAREQTP